MRCVTVCVRVFTTQLDDSLFCSRNCVSKLHWTLPKRTHGDQNIYFRAISRHLPLINGRARLTNVVWYLNFIGYVPDCQQLNPAKPLLRKTHRQARQLSSIFTFLLPTSLRLGNFQTPMKLNAILKTPQWNSLDDYSAVVNCFSNISAWIICYIYIFVYSSSKAIIFFKSPLVILKSGISLAKSY